MNYPKLEEKALFSFNGKTLDDPYQWIRDQHQPEVLKWVSEENANTDTFFKKHSSTYEKYYQKYSTKKSDEVISNISECKRGYFISKHTDDGNFKIELVDEQFKTIEEYSSLLKDFPDTRFYNAQGSPTDARYMYFFGGINGESRPSLYVYNLDTKQFIKRLDGVFYSCFDATGKAIIYADCDIDVENSITINHVKRYVIESDTIETLYTYPQNSVLIAPYISNDGKNICAEVYINYSEKLLVFNTDDGFKQYNDTPACVNYCGSINNNHFILSYEDFNNGKLVKVSPDLKTSTVFYSNDELVLESALVLEGKIIVFALKDASSVLFALDENGNKITDYSFPEYGDISCAMANDGKIAFAKNLFVSYESFIHSPAIYHCSGNKINQVYPKDVFSPDESILVEQRFYPSADGTKVPCFIVRKKDCELNGNNPTLMYGYGGYAMSSKPTYSNPFVGLDIPDWVNGGGIYVHCNIRGGSEYGEQWHVEGMKLNKKNCYYDFIGIAEGIMKDGYTKPAKCAICGGSNGGLLVTALLTMRPELWGCVVGSVPHTDMISFVNDDRGPMYITEYGDPHDQKQFEYFLTYSPFHNIKRTSYPPTYIQTGECDNNVPPYHGKKFAARLQQWNTSDNPVLLRVLAKGSHDRGSGEAYIQTISEMQAFLEMALK